mgnify:CR=1 FL=1
MNERQISNLMKWVNITNDIDKVAELMKVDKLRIESKIFALAMKGEIDKAKAKSMINPKLASQLDKVVKKGLSKPIVLVSDTYKKSL